MSRAIWLASTALIVFSVQIVAAASPGAATPAGKRFAQAPQATPTPSPSPGRLPHNPVIRFEVDTDVLIKLGDDELAQHHFDKAAAAYGNAIERDNKSWRAYLGRAKAYGGMGNDDAALPDYEAVITLAPGVADAYRGRGRILAVKSYWEKALADFKKAIELDPNNALGYTLRGRVHIRSYRMILVDLVAAALFMPKDKGWDELMAQFRDKDNVRLLKPYQELAIADFDKAISLDPTHAAHYLARGEAYLITDTSDDAADLAQSAVSEMKKSVGAPFGFVPDTRRAVADFSKAIVLEPKNPDGYRLRAWAAFKAGHPESGWSDANHAVALDPKDAKAIATRGVINEALGRKREAIADYRAALNINPQDRLNQTRLNRVDATAREAEACEKAHGDDAIGTCSRLLAHDPQNAGAYFSRGKAYSDLGYKSKDNYDRAIADFDQAVRLDPNNANAYRERAGSYGMKRDDDHAIADFSEAVKHDPKDAKAYKGRGDIYRRKGDLDRALADYDRAIEFSTFGFSFMDYTNRGDTYFAKGDYDRAIADYDQVIMHSPKYPIAYNNRGKAYLRKGDYDQAIADFDHLATLDPDYGLSYDSVYFNRGNAYLGKGDYERAIADYEKAIAHGRFNAAAHVNLGNAYLRKGDYDGALAAFNEGISLNPKDAVAYNNRASVNVLKGEYNRAFTDAEEAIRLDPKDAHAFGTRGEARIGMGDYDGAIADLDRSITLDARVAESYSDRGYAYGRRDRPGDRERATADLDNGIALKPDYARGYAYRAAIDELRGDPERAIADAGEAIRLAPKDAFGYVWRSKAYEDKGDHEHAAADHDAAVRLNAALALPQPAQPAPTAPVPPNNPAVEWRADADVYVKQGDIERANNNFDNAVAAYDHAIAIDGKNALAYSGRGMAYNGLKNDDRALTDYNTALSLDPALAVAYRNRGIIWIRKLYWDKALEDLKKSIEIDPNQGIAYEARGTVYTRNFQMILVDKVVAIGLMVVGDQAKAVGNSQKDKDAVAAKTYEDYAKELLKSKDASTSLLVPYREMARADLDKAVALDPKSVRAHKIRGGIALVFDHGYAVADLARTIDNEMKKNVGAVYGLTPDFEGAIADFSKVIELAPKDPDGYRGRAYACFKTGRLEEGLKDAEQAVVLAPTDAAAVETRGLIFEAMGNTTQAIADYRKATSLAGGNNALNKERLHRLGVDL